MKFVFFVKRYYNSFQVLRIKKKEDERWYFFEGTSKDIKNHLPILLEKAELKTLSKRGSRIEVDIDYEHISIYYNEDENVFKFRNTLLLPGKPFK